MKARYETADLCVLFFFFFTLLQNENKNRKEKRKIAISGLNQLTAHMEHN